MATAQIPDPNFYSGESSLAPQIIAIGKGEVLATFGRSLYRLNYNVDLFAQKVDMARH